MPPSLSRARPVDSSLTSSPPSASASITASRGRVARSLRWLRQSAAIPWIQLRQALHNGWGILNVWDLILVHPMAGGLLPDDHPFCTGLEPETGDPIWPSNRVYATPRASRFAHEPSDREILIAVGGYMAGMVRKAAASPEHPSGRWNRMPPAIYYIHGGVHYNGGWLLFNDFEEAISHFSDRRFLADFHRFVRVERREPLIVFRSREVDARSYQDFIGFLRANLPYFANSNGRSNRPLWGNSSPHPVVNVVTGSWIRDTRLLLDASGRSAAPRAPIPDRRYFQHARYAGERNRARAIERWLGALHALRIAARGRRGNVYFVDQSKDVRFSPQPPTSLLHRLRERAGRSAPEAH